MLNDDSSSAPIQTPSPRWDATTRIFITIVMIILLGLGLYFFRVVFMPLIVGGLIAYILSPLVRWAHRTMRLPYGLATGLTYVILLAIVVPVIIALSPYVVQWATSLQEELIKLINSIQSLSGDETFTILNLEINISEIVNEVARELTGVISRLATESIGIVFTAAETILMIVFTLLIGFYLTRDADIFIDWFKGLVPHDYRGDISRLLTEVDLIWRAFFQGQIILVIVDSIILTTIAFALGLPQPVLMGVFGGLLEFLPSIGHTIWLITAALLALIEGSTYLPISNLVFMLIVIAVQLIYTQFDLNVFIPRIIGRQVHLHPMVIIIGIIIGATVGGVLGVVLAAPTIASLRVIGRYVYAGLLGLDPFPMIGPVSAPPPERERWAEEKSSHEEEPGFMTLPTPDLSKLRELDILSRVGRKDAGKEEKMTEDEDHEG